MPSCKERNNQNQQEQIDVNQQEQIDVNQQEQIELYTVLINKESLSVTNLDLSKYDGFSLRGDQYINTKAPGEKNETILNNNYILNYLYSVSSSVYDENLDYYYDNSLDCQVAYSSLTGKVSKIMSQDLTGKIIAYEKSTLEEDSYFLWLKDVINNTFNINTAPYSFSCRTYFTDGSVEDSFVSSQTIVESQVDFYYFEYAKYIGEYRSAEVIKLIANPDGSIQSMIHSEVPYQTFEKIIVDEEKLNQTIEKTVSEIYSSKYAIKSYAVKSMVWMYYKDTPYLMCGVEIISTCSTGEEMGSSIILAVAFETTYH